MFTVTKYSVNVMDITINFLFHFLKSIHNKIGNNKNNEQTNDNFPIIFIPADSFTENLKKNKFIIITRFQ